VGSLAIDLSTLLSLFLTAAEVLSIAFIPLVLLRRKEPASTFAWIFVLLAFPALGVVLFWFLGRDRVRRPVRQRQEVNQPLRSRLEGRVVSASSSQSEALRSLIQAASPELRGVMRLAARMGRADVRPGNAVEVLVGAPDTYASLHAAIEAATDHVHLQYYAFDHDETGLGVVRALERAAERGVEVRLLYDAFGSRGLGRHLRTLERKGGRSAAFFPLDPIRKAATINLRNHRKIAVVDGRVGYCGGVNVGSRFVPWRDVHLRIEGPAVTQLAAIFVEDWFFASREDLVGDRYVPIVPECGSSVMQIVESGPDQTVERIHRLLFAAIASAQTRVWLTTPYFVPDRAILMALTTAAARGVDVRIVTPAHSNWGVTQHAGRSFYEELLAAGVRVLEYQDGMLHTKTLAVDGRFAVVGSANVDVRSFRLNFELVAVLYDEAIVRRIEGLFEDDASHAREITAQAWAARGLGPRMLESVGRLLAPLL
jgi:cardiolipin synthase